MQRLFRITVSIAASVPADYARLLTVLIIIVWNISFALAFVFGINGIRERFASTNAVWLRSSE